MKLVTEHLWLVERTLLSHASRLFFRGPITIPDETCPPFTSSTINYKITNEDKISLKISGVTGARNIEWSWHMCCWNFKGSCVFSLLLEGVIV